MDLKQLCDFGILLFYLKKREDVHTAEVLLDILQYGFYSLFQEGALPAPLSNVVSMKEM